MATINTSLTATATAAEVLAAVKGKHLRELPAPAAVVDRKIVASHCTQMLEACKALGVGLRAHVKTHKTLECAQLQAGTTSSEINLIASTLPEIGILEEWLLDEKAKGRRINVLYSMPTPISACPGLASLSRTLGPGSLSLMIDNPGQLLALPLFPFPPLIFLKVDTGYHRAGHPWSSADFERVCDAALTAQSQGLCILHGVYSHASHSYASTNPDHAMAHLQSELEGAKHAADVVRARPLAWILQGRSEAAPPLTLSVGATPSATSAQNLVQDGEGSSEVARALRKLLDDLKADPLLRIELHAGVYVFLDLQQLSTQASPSSLVGAEHGEVSGQAPRTLSPADVAFTVLADVASVYPARDPPQALIAAGGLALGREPCPRYSGWGAVSAWGMATAEVRASQGGWGGGGLRSGMGADGKAEGDGHRISTTAYRSGWVLGKISQEHGVLYPEEATGWEGSETPTGGLGGTEVPFRVGQKVRVLPNHACIAAAQFPWFYVVDGGEEVVDVWIRCRGW